MAGDRYTKTRVAGYFNNLLQDVPNGVLKLMKKYAICPPDDIGSYKGNELGKIKVNEPTAVTTRLQTSNRSEDISMAKVDKPHKVAYISLSLKARGGSLSTGIEGGDRITFTATYTNTPGFVPVYFLPWNTAGAAIRLTIPRHDPTNPGPEVFFTAAINGCSIFFQGTADHPTIYHCGGDTGQGVNAQYAADFWQDVVDEFVAEDTRQGRNKGGLSMRSVDKTQYIKTPGVGSGPMQPGEGKTTLQAKTYQTWLNSNSEKNLRIEAVNPWACVMGYRVGNDWRFLVQENATVVYHQLYKKHWYSKKRASETRYVARPMVLREVFPNGTGVHRVNEAIPRIL